LKKSNKALDSLDAKERKLIEFGDLIDTIESADAKKKFLWKEIYNNAVNDREYASVLYTQLFSHSGGNSSDHVTTGPILIKYLERMGKCTDQLIKLAEIIEGSDKNKTLPEDMYDAIQEK
jgi:hypothetical protein